LAQLDHGFAVALRQNEQLSKEFRKAGRSQTLFEEVSLVVSLYLLLKMGRNKSLDLVFDFN